MAASIAQLGTRAGQRGGGRGQAAIEVAAATDTRRQALVTWLRARGAREKQA